MNYLVYLDSRAGELEKILSGVKTMLVKEFDPAQTSALSVNPGDSLYFLRDQDDCAVRVKATVVRILFITQHEEDLAHTLKEMQPRLQLTEEQFNFWAGKDDIQLVEFESAHKISVIQVASRKTTGPVDWIAFEAISQITSR
ncbi:MAG: hypothetical protein EHM21_14355 [Chloroflexi bacterium]|nr:MAG: hypothetical protein EHM21_14355 [Chloroflexota bacterium]